MFSHYPSYYSTSPFDSLFSEQPQPDPHRLAALRRRQQIEAARREEAIREARARAEEERLLRLRLQQQQQQEREERGREIYLQRLRDQEHRRRMSQFYQPDDEDEEEDEPEYYQNPLFPFGFPARQAARSSRARPARPHKVPAARPESQSPKRASSTSINIPILSPELMSSETVKVPRGSAVDSEKLAAAVSLIQSTWRLYAARKHALTEIQAIRDSFVSLQSSFEFPASPDFAPIPSHSQSTSSLSGSPASLYTSKLAFTPANRPIHIFEDAATKLLTRLDGIDSAGDAGIRKARKALVVEIEGALGKLEDMKTEAWNHFCGVDKVAEPESSPEAAATESSVMEVEPSAPQASEVPIPQGPVITPSPIDPESVPLPPSSTHSEAGDEDEDMIMVERTVTPTVEAEDEDEDEWFDASDDDGLVHSNPDSDVDVMDFL